MTHDFASKKHSSAGKKQSSTKSSKSAAKFEMPTWLVLVTGIATGLFIAFLFYLAYSGPLADPKQLANEAKKQIQQAQDPQTTDNPSQRDSELNKPRFDFYTLLPELEVVVPQLPEPKPERQSKDSPNSDKPSHTYILQTGSFRNYSDAESLRASLLLQGLNVKIQKVTIGDGEIWHRVQAGPYTNERKLFKAEDKLAALGVDSIRLRLK